MSLPQTRSTTTFTSGSSLTITKNSSTTLITRHPRTIPTRVAETRSKSLLTTLTTEIPPNVFFKSFHIPILLALPLITLIPLALHILHREALITTLTHIAAALFTLVFIYICYNLPHITYIAVTSTELIHRPRGLLRTPLRYSLSTIRGFHAVRNRIVSESSVKKVTLVAPDHETASTAAQALNKALAKRDYSPPPETLTTDGHLVITGTTPLSHIRYYKRLDVERIGDRVVITTLAIPFPKLVFLFLYFFLTHLLTSLLLIFVFDDMPSDLSATPASTISAIALAGVYLLTMAILLLFYAVRCIPRKWRLVVAGYRKDVEAGMIDVGRCREVVLSRKKHFFRVRVVSSTGNAFLDIGGLCEAEATTLLAELREAFPGLFQIGV